MTPRQADRIIKAGRPITIKNSASFDGVMSFTFTHRDRWHIYTTHKGEEISFDRSDVEVVSA